MELYLLRHGRSCANDANLVTGDKADPLSPAGRKQAVASAKLLHQFNLDDCDTVRFVSDWKRAQETAALAVPDMPFTVDARLGETNAGMAAQMKLSTFNHAYPDFWTSFSPERPYPNGESHADLYTRMLAWTADLTKTFPTDAKVLAVTHAGPICAILHSVCKTDMVHFPIFLSANAALTKIEQTSADSWRLAFFSLSSEMAV